MIEEFASRDFGYHSVYSCILKYRYVAGVMWQIKAVLQSIM